MKEIIFTTLDSFALSFGNIDDFIELPDDEGYLLRIKENEDEC